MTYFINKCPFYRLYGIFEGRLIKFDLDASLANNDRQNTPPTRIGLAECYIATNQLALAKQNLDSAESVLRDNDDISTKLKLFKQYAAYYAKAGEMPTSILYYNRYIDFKDSIDRVENVKQLIAIQVASQMSDKEKQIIDNLRSIQDKKLEVSRQKTIRNAFLFCGIVLLIAIVIVSNQLRKTRSKNLLLNLNNQQIASQNEIINKSLDEKILLIKEIHHRVKNNLQIISSLLKLQAAKSLNTEVTNSLLEAEDRINSMALLHQLLYRNKDMSSLNFEEYLLGLLQQISFSFSSSAKNIQIKTSITPLELDLDTAIPLGLITNELISNAYKHAFNQQSEGEITIELQKALKNTYCLKVFDNGVGLPQNFELETIDSLGLEIVSILSDQINAELKIYNQNGAHFEIMFKVA